MKRKQTQQSETKKSYVTPELDEIGTVQETTNVRPCKKPK